MNSTKMKRVTNKHHNICFYAHSPQTLNHQRQAQINGILFTLLTTRRNYLCICTHFELRNIIPYSLGNLGGRNQLKRSNIGSFVSILQTRTLK